MFWSSQKKSILLPSLLHTYGAISRALISIRNEGIDHRTTLTHPFERMLKISNQTVEKNCGKIERLWTWRSGRTVQAEKKIYQAKVEGNQAKVEGNSPKSSRNSFNANSLMISNFGKSQNWFRCLCLCSAAKASPHSDQNSSHASFLVRGLFGTVGTDLGL